MFSKQLLYLAMRQIWICDTKHGYNTTWQDKVKRHTISGVLGLGRWQPELHAYITCVRIQEITDLLYASSHLFLQDLAFDLKLKQN